MHNLSKDFTGKRPLLIQPGQAEAYLHRVSELEIPLAAKMSDMGEMLAAVFGHKPTLEKFPPVAIIPVKGVIGKNLSELESLCGSCDIDDIEEMLEDCERDPTIKTIILDIDSPGGTSVGVPELANRIKNCSKHVVSFTESECCSAAYWIGSQASSFYATPSSSVGSIGVYIAFPDCSEAYKMEGVKMDVIKSGTFKGAGIPGTSLDDSQREMLQGEVKEIHDDFKAAVKSVRSFVEDSSMEGQQFSGKKGAEAGLVTALVNGYDEMIEMLDPGVSEVIESSEENKEMEQSSFSRVMSAAERALSGLSVQLSYGKPKGEDEDEDEDDKPKDEDEDDKPKDEDEDEDEDKDPKSEDDSEKDGAEPQPDDEDKPDDEKSKDDAEDEDDSGDKAVDTDSKHDKSGVKRNRSGRIA